MNFEQLRFAIPASGLPSPKIRKGQRTGFSAWAPFLPAFSEDFALAALKFLADQGCRTVYDPFVGSGTTLVAAAKLGLRAIGNDLDPVSALISRAKIASQANEHAVQRYLERRTTGETVPFSKETTEWFKPADLAYASVVLARIKSALRHSTRAPFDVLLSESHGEFDSEAVALAAITIAASRVARTLRGSNPVWYRSALQGEIVDAPELHTTARHTAQTMLADLDSIARFPDRKFTLVTCRSAEKRPPTRRVIDGVLTSPPYLNRLDYVISHLPEMLLLDAFHHVDVDSLRRSMIGTTKVLERRELDSRAGGTCLRLLAAVRKHPSYASEIYYLPIYTQYFNSMVKVFDTLKRVCAPGARGLLVVQNSYYKELLIDSTVVFGEMAELIGFSVRPLSREEVSTHYGNLSPRQLHYVPKKRLTEWVLEMRF